MVRYLRQFTMLCCRSMGIDTQLHVKSRNADTARVELLQRKLVLLEHSGKLVQLQPPQHQYDAAAFVQFS